jgi:predicted methyltransferase
MKTRKKLPPIITSVTAKQILNNIKPITVDLGISFTTYYEKKDHIILKSGEKIPLQIIEKISKITNSAFLIKKEKSFQIAISSNQHYKLLPTDGAPTLEIDGIRMHRTRNTTPDKDSKRKIELLGIDHGQVLDTCMGLGYTAIMASLNGAEDIITIEKEPSVINIALVNPWSQNLFESDNIHKILADTNHIISLFKESSFDYIIHDPPRMKRAGNLYSFNFYKKIYSILKFDGKLFHYTGKPRSRYRGVNIPKGVKKRLQQAGFKYIRFHDEVLGYTCTK